VFTSGKPPPPRLTSVSVTPSVLSYLTRFPSSCIGPGALPELGAALRAAGSPPSPPLSFDDVNRAGELRISVARPPHCNLVLSTVLGRCVVAHGCAPWTPSRRPANRCPAPHAPHCALCASPPHSGRCRVCPPRRVGGDVGRPHAVLWATPGQAAQAARTVPMGRSRGFWPVDNFLIEILFYFSLNPFQI
jgi:hypothetical protein